MPRTRKYFTCPFCHQNYKGIIPKEGDGTGALLPRHKYTIGRLTTFPKKIVCPGSHHLMEFGQETLPVVEGML